MKKLFTTRKWLIVAVVAALAVPAVAAGVAFAAGVADPNDYVRSVEYVKAVSPSAKAATKSISVNCPSPKKVIGGGASTSVATSLLRTSIPLAAGAGWSASATGLPIGTWTLEVWAVCADVHGTGVSTSSGTTSSGSNTSSGNTSGSESSSGSNTSSGNTSGGNTSGSESSSGSNTSSGNTSGS